MSQEGLSEEQRRRIEENRKRALSIRLSRENGQSGSAAVLNKPNSSSFTPIKPKVSLNVSPFGRTEPTKRDCNGTPRNYSKPQSSVLNNFVVKCSLTEGHRFAAECCYHKDVVERMRSVPEATYKQRMKGLSGVTVEPLPVHILNIFGNYVSGAPAKDSNKTYDLRYVDPHLLENLFPFQRECINFAVSRGGRVLIADDMGLGKTLEALGVMCYYRDEWPALIICPASLRYVWKSAVQEWLPSVKREPIVFDMHDRRIPQDQDSVVIVAYNYEGFNKYIASRQQKFKVVILDESHFIKNCGTKRFKVCEKVIKDANRVVLLSGTPALSRPSELYTQINVINPNLFRSFTQFASRYCNPKPIRIGGNRTVFDYSGASNMEELQILLRESIMIRRVKEDVLGQLPPKTRGIIMLDKRLIHMDDDGKRTKREAHNSSLKDSERKSALLEFYALTANVKLRAVTEYVLDLLEKNRKFLLFAHHRIMLDSLQESIVNANYELIRIDGSTASEERKRLCDRFQYDDNVRVALLSIKAANTGLTLTAANLVVFAELSWNPGDIAQAEDRAHRVGQQDNVQIQYLIAQGTADDYMWHSLQTKMSVLNQGGLSKEQLTAQTSSFNCPTTKQMDLLEFLQTVEDMDNMEIQALAAKRARLEPE